MSPESRFVPPTLAELAQQLELNGMVVVPYKDYVEIRLGVFAHVKVRIVDGRLSCEPRFGFLPRDRATWATLIGLTALTATVFLDYGVTSMSMVLGFVSVMSASSTAIRYQLTEACITRVQTAFMLLTSGQGAIPSSLGGADVRRELAEPAPRITSRERENAPVRRTDV